MRHNETHTALMSYLLRFSVTPPFFAASGQISCARVCFQGIHMKAGGFLNLVFQHRASHIPEAVVATMIPHHALLFLYLSKASFQYFFFFLVVNTYLCLNCFHSISVKKDMYFGSSSDNSET